MITRTTDRLQVRAANTDISLLPPPLHMGHSYSKPASRSNNDEVKNIFRILALVLLIVAVIAIITIRIVKQGRKKRKAAARAAEMEMEMALQVAVQQQASRSNEEQLPSYAEAIAAESHRIKSGEARKSVVVVNNQEGRQAVLPPDPADIGNGVRSGSIFQPPQQWNAPGRGRKRGSTN
ncbi:hypothetical protein BLS_001067 [Venturia inaequalis]|uniref:Uncharacterized protein n=1 Tax=Venturia inaequalis TaxID=5025 RepID=A0A8H3UWH8_VENIN|nr:hypothetical protein BLS_001067 [Venturia inaequalis]